MSFHHFQLLALALISSVLLSCYQSPPFVYVGGEPEPTVPGEDHICVNYDDSNNPSLSLYEAVMSRSDVTLFAEWVQWLAETDIEMNVNLKGLNNSRRTLLVPNNDAMKLFALEYDITELSSDQLHRLIKHHVLMTNHPFDEFQDVGFAAGMNREPVEYRVVNEHCVTFERRGTIVVANDFCSNGMLHVIDQVLIPARGF